MESGNVTLQAIRRIKAAILQSRYMAARLANKEQLKLYYAVDSTSKCNFLVYKIIKYIFRVLII
jgi:hypothetical protein